MYSLACQSLPDTGRDLHCNILHTTTHLCTFGQTPGKSLFSSLAQQGKAWAAYRLATHLAMCEDGGHLKPGFTLPLPLAREEFVSAKLAPKLAQQLKVRCTISAIIHRALKGHPLT